MDIVMQKGSDIINFMFVFGIEANMDVWEYRPKKFGERKLVSDFDSRYHELLEAGYAEV